ncbi:MAG: hypothetical protein EPN82_08105 [Bacteroidetes bacterium]|nr:MAG: hypothetical protein EPN82_08105 [Bacteroidota bacterium]
MPNPVGYYKFDVKTDIIEKAANAGAKAGLKANIENCGWAEVVETGEDYSLWIDAATRDKNKGIVHLEFNFELRTATFMGVGDLIKIKHFTLDYDPEADWENVTSIPDAKALTSWCQKEIEKLKKNGLIDFAFGGALDKASKVTTILNKVLGYLDPTDSAEKQAEAVLVGTLCYSQLQSWMLEHEQGKW